MAWKPREVKDVDKGQKFPETKTCPRHGTYLGKFCLRCMVEGATQVSEIKELYGEKREKG